MRGRLHNALLRAAWFPTSLYIMMPRMVHKLSSLNTTHLNTRLMITDALWVRDHRVNPPIFLRWHVLVLLGYALLGRGFAYLGYAPLYVAEITVIAGVLTVLRLRRSLRVFRLPVVWCLSAFIVCCAFQTIPYIGAYGLNCFRDGVLWEYSIIGIVIAGILISRPVTLNWLTTQYAVFVNVFIALGAALFFIKVFYRDLLLVWPGTMVTVIDVKPGDTLVHFGGCFAAIILGISRDRIPKLLVLTISSFAVAVSNRGGTVALIIATLVAFSTSPSKAKIIPICLVLCMIGLVTFIGPSPEISYGARTLSPDQLLRNMTSLFSNAGGDLEGTKEWRLQWWRDIIDYTFRGDYFWTGKGFGINLAESDGHALLKSQLRSPHNSHLTILARAGVPGFLLWILLQTAWATSVVTNVHRSRRRGDIKATRLFGILLAYWSGFVVNACFDVVLEGPMAGIWFWTIFGVGLGSSWLYSQQLDRPKV